MLAWFFTMSVSVSKKFWIQEGWRKRAFTRSNEFIAASAVPIRGDFQVILFVNREKKVESFQIRLLVDPSEQSVLLQKEGLKVYFALTQYILPLDLISKEAFAQWMEVCRQVSESYFNLC